MTSTLSKVLIVEDEVHCLRLLELTLGSEGFETATASHGEEALEKGKSFAPHVLISDWRLKDAIDGIEVAKLLTKDNPELKVIMFSGSPSDELQAHADAEDLKIFMALEKPLGLDDVIAAIRLAVKS